MYLVLKLCKWETVEWNSVNHVLPYPVETVTPEGEAGFLKAFTDYEKALEFAGNDSRLVMEIQETEGGSD